MSIVGRGTLVSGDGFEGRLVRADDVDAVLDLLGQDLGEAVLLTDQASATAVAPLLTSLAGVVCTQGGHTAHLAIVSRALGLPCLMGAIFEAEAQPGARVRVTDDGAVHSG
ncbi:MAG: PEP-utilizing enzyme [Solirubrobacteraceae bacterium]